VIKVEEGQATDVEVIVTDTGHKESSTKVTFYK